jgi:DNA-binding response OmpR family regulator
MVDKPIALIVEDDIDLSTIFAEALRSAGFEAQVVRDGAAAAERLRAVTPDVVVLDLHLPHVSGMDILEQIGAGERLSTTRVIVTTADPRMAEIVQDRVDLVLIKPISFVQLRDLASRLMAHPSGPASRGAAPPPA